MIIDTSVQKHSEIEITTLVEQLMTTIMMMISTTTIIMVMIIMMTIMTTITTIIITNDKALARGLFFNLYYPAHLNLLAVAHL